LKNIESTLQTNDGLQLFVREWHPEIEPLAIVCLLHGKGEHSGRYPNLASALNNTGYILLTFDLRGHGKSQGKRGHAPSYKSLMDDISKILDLASSRYPKLPCFLYGHSMGGNLVINYVLRCKPKLAGVIATGPWLKLSFRIPLWKIIIGKIMYNILPSFAMTNTMTNQYLSRDSKVIRAYNKDPLVHNRISVRLAVDIIYNGEWALEHADKFSLPLLIMHGGADCLTSPEASRKFSENVASDCTYKLWEGLYHEIHNEPEQKEVFEFLIKWIKKHH